MDVDERAFKVVAEGRIKPLVKVGRNYNVGPKALNEISAFAAVYISGVQNRDACFFCTNAYAPPPENPP